MPCWIIKMPHPLLIFSQSGYLIRCWFKFTYLMTNSAYPDQLASSEANWSGSILFAMAEHTQVQQDQGWPLVLITTAKDNIFFSENKAWHFMGIVCSAENPHEMPSLILSEKKKKNNWSVICYNLLSALKVCLSTDKSSPHLHVHIVTTMIWWFGIFNPCHAE